MFKYYLWLGKVLTTHSQYRQGKVTSRILSVASCEAHVYELTLYLLLYTEGHWTKTWFLCFGKYIFFLPWKIYKICTPIQYVVITLSMNVPLSQRDAHHNMFKKSILTSYAAIIALNIQYEHYSLFNEMKFWKILRISFEDTKRIFRRVEIK